MPCSFRLDSSQSVALQLDALNVWTLIKLICTWCVPISGPTHLFRMHSQRPPFPNDISATRSTQECGLLQSSRS